MTRDLLRRLWDDDRGAVIATEWLFFVTIMVIGLIVGMVYVRNAVSAELAEVGMALVALDQTYAFGGINGARGGVLGLGRPTAFVEGAYAVDQTTRIAETRITRPTRTVIEDNPNF